jgi:hypothetical protein
MTCLLKYKKSFLSLLGDFLKEQGQGNPETCTKLSLAF